MRTRTLLSVLFALAGLLSGPAMADWDPTMVTYMHYPQLPQEDPALGMDIQDTVPTTLGDDFVLTKKYPITDIHIWGSWLNDVLPVWGTGTPAARPDNVTFKISLWSDVPAGSPNSPYSHPGQLLWQRDFQPGQYKFRVWSSSAAPEKFFEPSTTGGTVLGSDYKIWQYNFYIPMEEGYAPPANTVTWLVITADVHDIYQKAKFGWKTTASTHFMDAAVWVPPTGGWSPLTYPVWHPWSQRPMDLSFVITQHLPGDINGDDWVDVADLLWFVDAFGAVVGDPNYDPACDFNMDGSIDVVDLLILVDYFGMNDP